jgi:hypothetical protein
MQSGVRANPERYDNLDYDNLDNDNDNDCVVFNLFLTRC